MDSKKNTFKIITLGCPLNQSESDLITEKLLRKGLEPIKDNSSVDIYIINSCVVTQNAARKSRKVARKSKKENPDALVFLMGCYGEIEKQELQSRVPEIDEIVGTSDREDIVKILLNRTDIQNKKNTIYEKTYDNTKNQSLTKYEPSKLRPVIKIQEGCNQSCSFCLVTKARGVPKSRSYIDIKDHIETYLEQGYREIILAGTNMGLYGVDTEAKIDLPELMYRLANLPYDNYRIRISSLEPMEIGDELLHVIKEHDKICNYLYLPLQSGSNRVLELMNRNYTTEQFAALIKEAQKLMPDIGLMTDLIAGFPGETEEDHNLTKEFIYNLGISKLHVFTFSPRPKTLAKQMSEQVRPDIKKIRTDELKELGKQQAVKFNESFVSTELQVLVENLFIDQKKGLKKGKGFSENYISVECHFNLNGNDKYHFNINRGEFINVIGKNVNKNGLSAVLKTNRESDKNGFTKNY